MRLRRRECVISEKDREDIRKEGDVMKAIDGFCVATLWNREYGCVFSGHLDDEVVGLKLMGDVELRDLVEGLKQ